MSSVLLADPPLDPQRTQLPDSPDTIPTNAVRVTAVGSGEVFFSTDEQLMASRWLASALDEIESLRHLLPNWDSYGAAAVNASSIRFAKAFIKKLPLRPTITATPDGNVFFCWATHELELDAEILPDGSIEYLYEHRVLQPEAVEASTEDIYKITAFLKGF